MKILLLSLAALAVGFTMSLLAAASDQFWVLLQMVGVLLIKEFFDFLRWYRTQQKVEEVKQEAKASVEDAKASVEEAKASVEEVKDEVRVNTQLTKVAGKQAQEARKEVNYALQVANGTNEKIQALAERPVVIQFSGDDGVEHMLTRCLAQVRAAKQERQRAEREYGDPDAEESL